MKSGKCKKASVTHPRRLWHGPRHRGTKQARWEQEVQRLLESELHQVDLERQNTELLHARAETEQLLRQYSELNASLERRVDERTEQLQMTIRDLQTFSYSVSHDLRSPLRSINSFASVLLEDYGQNLDQEGRRLVSAIVKKTVGMAALIDDLLNFSKNSRQELSVQTIDMTPLVRELIEKFTGNGLATQVEFRVAELPQARGDRAMVAQALENLIANAVKFSSRAEHPVVEVGWYERDHEQVFFVKDNGIGFDMKYASAIFGVFERLHSSEEYEGSGVGLAIVEQVITRQGGKVWAAAESGTGATFYFSLPKP